MHLRGPLVAVAVRGLAEARAFGRIARAPLGWCPLDALPLPRAALEASVALLAEEGWLARDGDLVHVTPEGLVGVRWMALYGYLVGYLGVLRQVPALLGRERAPAADPTVVKSDRDRALLLAGKAQVFARGGLREPLEETVRAVFDAEPVAAQPRVLLDMSAGDGSVLAALHELIVQQSARGAALDRHPLTLVGLVGNASARERAADRLARAGVPCLLLQAAIEDPDAIAADLARSGLDLRDALVVSKTCIHGRAYRGAHGAALPAPDSRARDAVFVTPAGELVAPEAMEDDLAAFFARWAAWLGRHGMIAADAHTVAPEVAAASWPVNVVTHVCATHGYSAQYLVEAEVFRRAARRGGFTSRPARNLGTELVGAPTMTLDHLVCAGATHGG
jgi:polyketide synthase PksN